MGDWGVLGRGEGGVWRRREEVCDFCVFIDYSIGGDFSLGFFFLLFFFFLFGRGGSLCISFLAFCPFSFLSLALFCLFSFPNENQQRLESRAIPSNHWAGSAKAMIVLRIAATFEVPSRSCSFVENWPFTISRPRLWKKSLTMLSVRCSICPRGRLGD